MPRRNLELDAALHSAGRLSAAQADVCTIAQARAAGLSDSAVRRLTVSGAWRHLHRGVYLTRRGPADLAARMWGAHLALGTNSVVGGRTAGRCWGLIEATADPAEPVVMVMPDNCSRVASGVLIRRVPDPSRWAHPARRPPVLTVEHTVLELFASARTTAEAVDVVLRSCRMRITGPARLLAAAETRPRLRGRDLFTRLCADVVDGVTSPLEQEYQRRVARPHRLPAGIRQAPAAGAGRRAYRDVRYAALGVIVELDGRLGHETESDLFRDQRRDNAAVLSGDATLRFGWAAVAGHPCEVAAQVCALGAPARLDRAAGTVRAALLGARSLVGPPPCDPGGPVWDLDVPLPASGVIHSPSACSSHRKVNGSRGGGWDEGPATSGLRGASSPTAARDAGLDCRSVPDSRHSSTKSREEAPPMASAPAGTLYRGGEGMWSWVAHRITGVAVFFFLLVHVLDTALVRVSPDAYDMVIATYKTPIVNLLEVGLVGAVLYHALNGLRIILVDFWAPGPRHQKAMFRGIVVVWALLMIPGAYFMLKHTAEALFGSAS